ncbi:uncharacterized protein VTP21DRAFT_4705 [Calcarisporiella thermophila]|uniref:uncharacterized protein n=1 Tax=Calcarisporiella thermophila TaxID=911321 RepID=UPI0037437FBB
MLLGRGFPINCRHQRTRQRKPMWIRGIGYSKHDADRYCQPLSPKKQALCVLQVEISNGSRSRRRYVVAALKSAYASAEPHSSAPSSQIENCPSHAYRGRFFQSEGILAENGEAKRGGESGSRAYPI